MYEHDLTPEELLKRRKKMVELDLKGRDITDPRVLEAFEIVPREQFVWKVNWEEAYEDHPLRIGQGQTISQPYMVALMTQELNLKGNEKVLEIGTGSGYQAAILAELAGKVCTVERIKELSIRAQETITRLGYKNINYLVGDGTLGWEGESPFDRIIVTASAPKVPAPLIEQLADGGILIAPIGNTRYQDLVKIEKRKGKLIQKTICGCVFVKLIGKEGWQITEE